MVSCEELIYAFTDIYLQTVVECSVCMENYEMVDDEEFWKYICNYSFLCCK